MAAFGLQIPNFTFGEAPIFERVTGLATAAETAGADSVWVMDHFYQLPALGGPDQPMLEAYTLLGALGARTTRVRLGSLVTGVTYRNPALLAKIVTTLDVITGGRAVLGIGAAWYDVEHDGMGFTFPTVRERMERLEEAVQICRAMFTEEQPSFTGRHYRIERARNVPRPLQAGGPPIMIGGSGEQRTLRLVARYADMCNVFGDPDTIRHKIGVLRKHCAEVGRDPTEITFTRLSTLIPTSSQDQTDAARAMLVQAVGEERARATVVGQEHEVIDQIAALAEAGVAYFIFNMPAADPAVVEQTFGTMLDRFGS